MRKILFVILMMASLAIAAEAISIYEVQFSSFAGSDGTYPSRYVGKKLSLDGIVTATNYRSGGYFISEAINGPWRGILILDKDARVSLGDRVVVGGQVSELYGMTCLDNISSTRIVSSGNSLPMPMILTTGQLSGSEEAEAYEGVYTKLLNTTVAAVKSSKGKIQINDGTGTCVIAAHTFGSKNARSLKSSAGLQYASITGIVVYGFSEFSLNPVNPADIVPMQPTFIQNRSWGTIKSIYK
ncbi:MAG: hypothetical protein KA984_04170 [Candidatus Cloacimonetes bacterium]|nr:hypothetical protein [Candidatus Cloacimonadota bacterium]